MLPTVSFSPWFDALIGGGIIVAGLLAFLLCTASRIVRSVTRPKRRRRAEALDLSTVAAAEGGWPVERVSFCPHMGKHLVSGWYLQGPRWATTTIVVCPGFHSHKAQVFTVAQWLRQHGHHVLLFDYYGHGEAVSKRVTLGYREQDDFLAALDYAKWRAPNTRLGVLAYSMGAAIAIICSASAPEVEALVADSAFATHKSAVRYNVRQALHLPAHLPFTWLTDLIVWVGDHWLGFRAGYRFAQVEPVRQIGTFSPRPLLLIHGERDRTVDPQDMHQLAAAAPNSTETWLVPEADHCRAYMTNRPEYRERVLAFFERTLHPVPPHADQPGRKHRQGLHAVFGHTSFAFSGEAQHGHPSEAILKARVQQGAEGSEQRTEGLPELRGAVEKKLAAIRNEVKRKGLHCPSSQGQAPSKKAAVSRLGRAYSRLVYRWRWVVIVFWAVLFCAAGPLAAAVPTMLAVKRDHFVRISPKR